MERGEGAGEVHSGVGVELCRAREAQVVPQRAVPVHYEEVEVHVNAHYGGCSSISRTGALSTLAEDCLWFAVDPALCQVSVDEYFDMENR